MDTLSKTFGKLTIPLLLLLVISFSALPALGQPWLGSGTAEVPYQIWTAADMNAIGGNSSYWDKHFKLMADIDLSGYTGTSFNIIGTDADNPFSGVFDGNDSTISNFTWHSATTVYVGLFGYVDGSNAEIKDLRLIDPNVQGHNSVGALVGQLQDGKITGCGVEGGAVSGQRYVGGLVGYNFNYSTISNCYATGTVTGNMSVGGLTGWNRVGTISNCYATGSVSGTGYFVGGLAGENDSWGTIFNCYATGSVSGDDRIGGLVGGNYGMIYVSFWDTESSGEPNGVGSGGSLGLTGKTTAQMYSMNTFLGWGVEPAVWTIDDTNDYPHLARENSSDEPITPVLSDLLEGSGTEEDPYFIYTPNDIDLMGLFSCEWNKYFKLMADIDLSVFSTNNLNLIGCFTGVFDGNGHSISNFTCQYLQDDSIGLFRHVEDPNTEIKDLSLIDPNVQGGDDVGALVGRLQDGKITGCGIKGGSVSGQLYVGGLAGYNSYGTISNSYATGDVTGYSRIGGLEGRNFYGTISNCYATGSVLGTDDYIGGLVGSSSSGGTISNCYATGFVSGIDYVGGLCGQNYSITSNCFWDIETSDMATSAGGTGKTTAEMQTAITFISAGWDFSTPIWKMSCEGMSYPKLSWWQPVLGDYICPDGIDWSDFAILTQAWLTDDSAIDIAPPGGDGIVNLLDFTAFADNWLAGLTPGQASNPNPLDGTSISNLEADLSWTAGFNATSHNVYFGTSSPPAFRGNQAATTFDPGTMTFHTTYYWRINEVNAYGTTTGTVWRFTIFEPPPPPPF